MTNLLRTVTFWRASAVAWLAIPYFLFLFGWLDLPLALSLGALLALGGWPVGAANFSGRRRAP